MDMRFPEWKKNEVVKALSRIAKCATWVGVVIGLVLAFMIYLTIDVLGFNIKTILVWVIWGIALGYCVNDINKTETCDIDHAIRPLMWDLRILYEKNKRLNDTIDLLRNPEEYDNIEYSGELHHEQYEEPLSEIMEGEDDEGENS